jgi:hypothetical protein
MAKIILVSGVGNSGKTESIRLFLANRGIVFPDAPRDILLILPIQKGGHTLSVGVASGGDTFAIVDENFKFFRPHQCDIIVCASKSHGRTIQYIQTEGAQPGNQMAPLISTRKIHSFNQAQAAHDNTRVATEIESNIP